jgi:hypothetical protein
MLPDHRRCHKAAKTILKMVFKNDFNHVIDECQKGWDMYIEFGGACFERERTRNDSE